MNPLADAEKIKQEMSGWRQLLHQNPQTAFEEQFASDFVVRKLTEFGIEVDTGWAKTGVLGLIKGQRTGKRIGFRADIDALNITEETGLTYQSKIQGKMHACGHDGHTTALLGAAKILAEKRDFAGEVLLIFQPAEEDGGGAKVMLEEGLFTKFDVESVWAMHNLPELAVGKYAMNDGGFNAAVWDFHITLHGSGGHAAEPHKTRDPIPVMATLISAFQSIVSRNLNPLLPGVLSVTRVSAGTTYNIIPDKAELWGTVRALDQSIHEKIIARMGEITREIGNAFEMEITLEENGVGYPVLTNSKASTDIAYAVTEKLAGKENTDRHFPASMGAEDFSFMLQKKPGCYIYFGNGEQGKKGCERLHTSRYDYNDDATPYAPAPCCHPAHNTVQPITHRKNMNNFLKVSDTLKQIQDKICTGLENTAGHRFTEDLWSYEHGEGGGRTRVITNSSNPSTGAIEKGGVNFSAVEGELNPLLCEKMNVPKGSAFKATGVSLVIHPHNPYAPTVHANVRYFETPSGWWVGGGIDLTPYYVFTEDAVHFHQTLKDTCDRSNPDYYARYKQECDEYFFLKHRGETRGVGGIFFDYLKNDYRQNTEFIYAVGNAFNDAYLPILKRRKDTPFGEREREFQMFRRGRYVEFNLVYDRGTLFGFQTGGRTESILMSLPPVVKWHYNYRPEAGTREAELYEYLKPIDWLKQGTP
ncbi:hypothetical protein CHS0354_030098 [Potamilus streckersoni]|uniref:coproporphyrinogen oxidase n=1 Tax=Potamilus streckersoni TaxID=2493646 RepID=A0AAE0RLS9_9BIVA|nr:hypothetical protein CHS0354_030098 [Potamilus streckersoni]